VGDFAYQFGVQHFVVFIQYDYGTCGEAAQGAAFDGRGAGGRSPQAAPRQGR